MLVDRLDRAEGPLEHLPEHVLALGLLHGQLAGHHLVEHAAQEIDVGAGVALGAVAGALERRVIDGALALDARLGLVSLHGRQAEIDQLGLARLEIRMLVPLMSRWVTPCSMRILQALRPCPASAARPGRSVIRVRSFMKSRRFIPSTYSMIM